MTEPADRAVTLYGITPDLVDEVRVALAAEIGRRQRAATRAAAELDAEDARDKRPGAVAIFKALTGAARLQQFADHLLAGWVVAGGALPADVAADVALEAAPEPPKPRQQVLAELDAEVAAVNGAEPADAIPGASVPPDGAPPSPADVTDALDVIQATAEVTE